MHKTIEHPVLYLDFDGVLHPDAAHRIRGQIVLLSEGARLFQWASVLTEKYMCSAAEAYCVPAAEETMVDAMLRRLDELTRQAAAVVHDAIAWIGASNRRIAELERAAARDDR